MSVKLKMIAGFAIILVMVMVQSWLIVSMNEKRDLMSQQALAMFRLNLVMKDREVELKTLEIDLFSVIRRQQNVPEAGHGDVRNTFSSVYIISALRQWHSAFTTSPSYDALNDALKQIIQDMKPPLDRIDGGIGRIRALPPSQLAQRGEIFESDIQAPARELQNIIGDFIAQNSLFFAVQNQSLAAYSSKMKRNQIIAIGAALLFILFVVFYAQYLLKPLNWLMDGVARIRNGDLSGNVRTRSGDELGRLAEQFNAMTDEIKTHREHLEYLVEKRTRQLLETQKSLERTNHDLLQTNMSLEEARRIANDKSAELEKTNRELSSTLDLLRATQSDLISREKMAALGDMVAGIAHEINTPVGVSLTAGSHLRSITREVQGQFRDGALTKGAFESYLDATNESAGIIEANLERAAELIISFKKVAVAQSSEALETFHPAQYLKDSVTNLLPALKRTKIRIVIECDESLTITNYPGAFTQVFTNLMMNTISHAYPAGEPGTVRITAHKDDGNIEIEYSDDGIGIRKEIIQRIFDPFFTTSRSKGGSGLGLHIVYNIVTQMMRGSIQVRSEEGTGTAFFIRVPIDIPADVRSSAQPT